MPLAIPKILIVADPAEQRELVSLLRGAGAPFTEAVIASSDGDDQTLGQFTELRPSVVVVTATLAVGDARSLVGAMREAAPKGVFVVLLGDERGPVKNALDALDFGCDRFVARPIAVKALRFAVMSGLGATSGGTGRSETTGGRAAMVSASQVARAGVQFSPADATRSTAPMASVRATDVMNAVRTTDVMDAVRTTDVMDAVRTTDVMDVAVRVTEPMAAVWGTDSDEGPVPPPAPPPLTRAPTPVIAARVTAPMPVLSGVEGAAARVTAPMAAVDAAVDAAAAVDGDSDSAVTTPVKARAVTEQRLRWEAIADAIGSGDEEGGDDEDDVAVVQGRVPTGEIEVGIERTIHADPPPERTMRRAERELEPEEIALTDAEVDDLSIDEPAADDDSFDEPYDEHLPDGDSEVIELPQAWRTGRHQVVNGSLEEMDAAADGAAPLSQWTPGSTDVPVAPVREPTLVLADPAAASTATAAARTSTVPQEVILDERQADGHDIPGAWGSSSQVSPAEDDDDVLSDVAAGVDEDLSIDLTRQPSAAAESPPSGGDFARELRRKMSAMAERLFRGADLPAAPVAIGPGHDHHTEIDLRGLVDDPALASGGDPYDVAGGGATFVGVEDLVTSANALATESRGTAEAGDIQRGISDAAALIARLFASDFTGHIVFRRGATEMVIHIESGRPVFASSNLANDRMGELLLREGKITAEQFARCRDLVRDTGRRMGEILVERGFLKRRELLPAVRRHVEDIIYSLFAWDQGEYRIVAGDGAASERIRLSRHPAAMVLEGVRRKLDRSTLERLLGPPTAVVETTDRDKLAAITGVADLSAEERAALAAFDGSADLAQVARLTGADLANVYQLAWGLHLLGLVTTRRRVGDDDDAPALVGESDLAIDRERVHARHALVLDADYFALIGVRRDASGFEIKRAYEAARRDFAADTFPAELRKELATELDDIAQVLDEAYRVLRDDKLRNAYVSHLRDFDEVAS